jgi:hypothetical protein
MYPMFGQVVHVGAVVSMYGRSNWPVVQIALILLQEATHL